MFMPSLDEQTLRDALRRVKYPGFSRDIVSFGLVKEIQISGADATIQMVITTAEPAVAKLEGVKHVIAVASGKGGVGKSTVASNLALAFAATGASAGLCDCDLYGPSIAHMFGSNERPSADEADRIIPIVREGIKLMSMGFLLDDGSPAVLRGPMVTRYTQQFLRQVAWAPLDYLILDLPPGTG